MADNFLEKHREEYEQRKAEWLKKRRKIKSVRRANISKPEDEAL